MQKITTCICFDNQAEEAVKFYISVFPDSVIKSITRCGENEYGGPAGSIRTIEFQIFGQNFLAVNGGAHFKFTDAVSLIVNCETQEEIDYYWNKLSKGGEEVACGWLTDKFGLSWQITPSIIIKMLTDPDRNKSDRVIQAILKMKKLDIEILKKAFEGK